MTQFQFLNSCVIIIHKGKTKDCRKEKKKKTHPRFWLWALEVWNYEQGTRQALAAQFSRVEAGAWQHNYRESSHNMWLNKQCILSPPKVPVSLLSLCMCLLNSCVACAFAPTGKEPVRICGHDTERVRGIIYAGKQETDNRLMHLCSNGSKLKQDEKGLHFSGAALVLMTRGPPTAISAYYNLEIALLCF